MLPPSPLSQNLSLVLPGGGKLKLPTIHPEKLPSSQALCNGCLTPWGKKTRIEGVLEFPFVVQPCQHIVGSACLHRMIDEGCPRCPICGVRIEIDGDDGEASGGAEESYDSPLSEAPDSPIWPVQQNFAVVDTMDTDTELKTETVMETETETASSTTSGGSRASMPCSNNWQGVETPPTSPPEQRDSPGWIRKGPGHAAIRTSMQVHSKDYCLGPWELEDEQQVQAALALLHMKYSDMWT